MSKNEPTGPSLISVIFIGFLTFCVGILLGIISLISQPVTTIAKSLEADEVIPGEVYYLRGDRGGRTAWRAKEDAWRAGMVDVLRLTESELNQWSRERLEVDAPSGDGAVSEFQETLQFIPSAVNFRVLDGGLQLATEIEFGGYLADKSVIYQVTGSFRETSGGVRFVPETGNIGSAPLGSVPIVRNWLFNLVKNRITSASEADWLGESFESVESVEVVDGQLVMRRKAEG